MIYCTILREMVEMLSTQVASLVNAKVINKGKKDITCFRCSHVGYYTRKCTIFNLNNNRGFYNNSRVFK